MKGARLLKFMAVALVMVNLYLKIFIIIPSAAKRSFKLDKGRRRVILRQPSSFLNLDFMNRERRKRIKKLQESLSEIQSELQNVLDEEQEAFDNLPESFQESEKGERMQEYIEYMEEALSSIEESIESLNEIE